jgi:hypothetical protein
VHLPSGTNPVEPAVDHPDAIRESGAYVVTRIADTLMNERREHWEEKGIWWESWEDPAREDA